MERQPSDTSIAPLILGVGVTLQVISATLVAARISARGRTERALFSHDWTILLAQALSFPQVILIISATFSGYGRRQSFVPLEHQVTAMRSIFISQVAWYWSATLVKISVALLLLTLKCERGWKIFLHIVICILGCSAIIVTLMQFLACRPVAFYWDPRVRLIAKCWPFQAITGIIVTFSTVQALADLVFSLIPLTFIVRLHQPLHQKITIAVLMSLGIFAAIAAIVRTILGTTFAKDQFRNDGLITLLALVELHLSIIAATLPTLKAFFEGLLGKAATAFGDGPGEEDVRWLFYRMGLLDAMHYGDAGGKGEKEEGLGNDLA